MFTLQNQNSKENSSSLSDALPTYKAHIWNPVLKLGDCEVRFSAGLYRGRGRRGQLNRRLARDESLQLLGRQRGVGDQR